MADIRLLKRTRILVMVDEAQPDLLVVSYEFGVSVFTGVLLDTSKRNLPCGIPHQNPVFTEITSKKPDDDSLFSVNQRFAYLDEQTNELQAKKMSNQEANSSSIATVAPPLQLTRKKNLHLPTKYKTNRMTVRLRPRQVLCTNCKGICNENSENVTRKRKPPETTESSEPASPAKRRLRSSHPDDDAIRAGVSGSAPVLIPKLIRLSPQEIVEATSWRSKGETTQAPPEVVPTPRTIKISYGPQGEGTILKIPPQCENSQSAPSAGGGLGGKSARRALKRAKKEARARKIMLNSSPLYLGSGSPRYAASPRYTVGSASPRHGLGTNSPRYLGCTSYDFNLAPRRRKHKMKHKKKHREARDDAEGARKHNREEGEVTSSTQDDTKEQCITQKLSINLKRLNDTYTASSTSAEEVVALEASPVLRIGSNTVTSAQGADGARLLVGDIVWGKIAYCPWWPGRILSFNRLEDNVTRAQVSWIGVDNITNIPCDLLCHYLDNFEIHYNKKTKGSYKDAIKQATSEAMLNAEGRERQPLGTSPSHNIIPQVVQPALASPREIDVVS